MSNIDYKIIGERIRKTRVERGISQTEMAHDFGLSSVFISRVEKGVGQINLKRLTQVSEYFNLPLSYFLNGTIENSQNYLSKEFKDILNNCSPEKQRMILQIAKVISNFE